MCVARNPQPTTQFVARNPQPAILATLWLEPLIRLVYDAVHQIIESRYGALQGFLLFFTPGTCEKNFQKILSGIPT